MKENYLKGKIIENKQEDTSGIIINIDKTENLDIGKNETISEVNLKDMTDVDKEALDEVIASTDWEGIFNDFIYTEDTPMTL